MHIKVNGLWAGYMFVLEKNAYSDKQTIYEKI